MPVPSPRVAVALIEELLRGGVRDVVLSPGSRSAPLALAVADAERRGLLRLHVRIDERGAGYLALGLARVSGSPVAVITTSGTAAVNLHPAIVEAAYSGVPLVAVTADRPGALRGSGANQTIDQRGLYGSAVVASGDVEGLEEHEVRALVSGTLDRAVGDRPGPVHINAPLVEPLVAPGEHAVSAQTVRARDRVEGDGASLTSLLPAGIAAGRGIIIAGDFDDARTHADAQALAAAMGWPVVSEPTGNLSSHPQSLRHGPLLLGIVGLDPEVVVTVGRVGLHRSVTATLRSARAHIAVDVPPRLGRVDPVLTACAIVDAMPHADSGSADPEWLAAWQHADARATRVIDEALSESPLSGPLVARIVTERAGAHDLLVVGASWPVRHVSAYAGPIRARCLGNRGTSGIDGVMSTAWGAAIAHGEQVPRGTTYAVLGDLTALYDRNALLAPGVEARPRLDYVVIDNDGGGIFSALEQGAPEYAEDFERVFGTPHGADLGALLAAPGVEVVTVTSAADLAASLDADAEGVRVIVARCAPRADEEAWIDSVQARVAASLR